MPATAISDAANPSGDSTDCRWRVLIAVPPHVGARQLAAMRAWLDQICGREDWHAAPAGLGGAVSDALAFYFADAAVARAFIARFACGYREVSAPSL